MPDLLKNDTPSLPRHISRATQHDVYLLVLVYARYLRTIFLFLLFSLSLRSTRTRTQKEKSGILMPGIGILQQSAVAQHQYASESPRRGLQTSAR